MDKNPSESVSVPLPRDAHLSRWERFKLVTQMELDGIVRDAIVFSAVIFHLTLLLSVFQGLSYPNAFVTAISVTSIISLTLVGLMVWNDK